MAIKCANCGGYFTKDELALRKRPRYPWTLTPAGQRALDANLLRGEPPVACPQCGHPTLLP